LKGLLQRSLARGYAPKIRVKCSQPPSLVNNALAKSFKNTRQEKKVFFWKNIRRGVRKAHPLSELVKSLSDIGTHPLCFYLAIIALGDWTGGWR